MLPVLDSGGAPAGTVQGGGGLGADGLPESLGAARLSSVRGVSFVLHLHVEDGKSPQLLRTYNPAGGSRLRVCFLLRHHQTTDSHAETGPLQSHQRRAYIRRTAPLFSVLLNQVDGDPTPLFPFLVKPPHAQRERSAGKTGDFKPTRLSRQ